ncbi:MAG: O-antigen ligase family protein [Methylobacter tundripaludum]|nr:O-antigen ligase family protein [Methylobacter tundripaludum]
MKFVSISKRAFAPFFVIAALLCLLQTSRYIDFLFWWLGLCLLAAFAWLQQERPFSLSWINSALIGFCLLLFTNALYLNPAYYAGGIYFPSTLLIAFIVASYRPVWLAQTGFKIFCAVIALIAVWALLQWLTGWEFLGGKSARAQALFSSTNTLATALNLGLIPVLGFYLLGRGGRAVYGLTLLLFAGLLTTQSRGGYLGLLSGILFFVTFVGQVSVAAEWRRYRAVAVGFIAVLAFFKFYAWLGLASWSMDPVFATLSHGDTSNRWEIYQVAWRGLAEQLWLGIGYYNFGYYFEAHKVPPFLDRRIIFVHNDYLEFALETGLLGLGLFLLLIIAVYGQLFKFRQQAMAGRRLPLILSAAAITSMLSHALVDYPFYIPVLMAVFGAYLGIINQQLIDMGATHWQLPKMSVQHFLGLRSGFIGNALMIGLVAWLGLPALALGAANYSSYRLLIGDAQHALFWSGVARTLQPLTASYYWKEGIIWRDQGVAQNRPELLDKGNAVFSQGFEVNPLEVNSLLEKIALHRQYGSMLKQPASHQDIMAWINYVKSRQPNSDEAQIEYVHCLDFVGEHAKAIEQAKILMGKRPQSKPVQKLFESVSHE